MSRLHGWLTVLGVVALISVLWVEVTDQKPHHWWDG
jgi:hypothetical protein